MGTGRLYDVWVTNNGSGTVSKMVNNVVVKTINVGSNPWCICVDKNNTIWVANYNSGTVSKIVNNVVVKTINVGSNPWFICVDKNNAIWVTNYNSNTVSKIVNDTVVNTITGFSDPYDICVDKNNAIWVTNWASNTVSKIVNDVVEKTISVGTGPYCICVDLNNNIWVANYTSNTVSKIVNDVVEKTISVSGTPRDICVDKNNIVWVANSNSATVSKIVNNIVQKTINVGSNPHGICVDKNNAILVSNMGSNNVSKIVNDTVVNTITGFSNPYGISTGMEYELLFGEKHLLQSGNIINTFNGTDFSNVGTSPVTDTMLETYGFSDFTGLTKSKLNTLTNPKLLTKKTDNNTTNTKYTGTPLPKLVLAKNDITLSTATSKVDNFTLTATEATAGSNIKVIYSVDQGTTWNTYKSGVQSIVNINDLSTIKVNGMTLTEFNSVTDWNTIITDDTIRFGYYLEVNSITDTVFTDLLKMQIDMNGAWNIAVKDTDYKFYYTNKNTAQVRLLSNGDYRMSL